MHVRCLAMLTVALATLSPAAAGESGPSYTMEEIRALAGSVHPSLAAAEAAVEAATGALRQARAWPNPGIAAEYGRGRPRDGGDSRSETLIEIVQPIELPGIREWRSRLAEAQLRGADVDRLLAGSILDETAAVLVTNLLLEERRAGIARESAGVAARLHELLARRVESGESSPLELSKALAEWFARRSDLLEAEAGVEAGRSSLRLFCGKSLPADFIIAATLEDPQAGDLPDDLNGRLHAHNPILRRAGVALEVAQARTEMARKESFPAIEVSAGHETELDREASRIGVGLTLPLWSRNQGAIAAGTAEQSAASAESRALALELESALEQASAAYRRALAAIRLHREGWTSAAGKALEIVTFSFENGEASLLDVLDAQRSRLSVGLAEAESWARLALARAEIERLIAGPLASGESHEAR